MTLPDTRTHLVLIGMGVPLYSGRRLTNTITPIEQAKYQRRTINGRLVDLSVTQFQKYEGEISCTDQAPPAIDGVWPGRVLTMWSAAELSFLTATSGPDRPAVSGSERIEGDFTRYRPILAVMLGKWTLRQDDFGASIGWTLPFTEV